MMNLAQQFKKSVSESSIEMFGHILGDGDNEELIKQHLIEFGYDAKIKDCPFKNEHGETCHSIDLIFSDGSECNIHEYDIETTA